MKTFTIIYLKTTREEWIVAAKNEKKAKEVFRAVNPDHKIVDVHEQDTTTSIDESEPQECRYCTRIADYGGLCTGCFTNR